MTKNHSFDQFSDGFDDDQPVQVDPRQLNHSQLIDYVLDLQGQMLDQDELVATLTERLEKTAEQLDRMRRGGSAYVASTQSSADTEQQSNLTKELLQAVEDWNDMQPAGLLEQLEQRLADLQNLLSSGRFNAVPSAAPSSPAKSAPPVPASIAKPAANAPSAWEQMKAKMMSGEPAPQVPDNKPQPPQKQVEPEEISGKQIDGELCTVSDYLVDLKTLILPPPVNASAASRDQLVDAVNLRDECIASLLNRLRKIGGERYQIPDWSQLQHVPEDLQLALEALELRISETLKLSEVELSMERARLAREEARLVQAQQQLEKKMRRLGIRLDADEVTTTTPEKPPEEKDKSGRWKRFLGINQDDSDN